MIKDYSGNSSSPHNPTMTGAESEDEEDAHRLTPASTSSSQDYDSASSDLVETMETFTGIPGSDLSELNLQVI